MYYANARYLNPVTGQFTSIDPASRTTPEQFLYDPQQLNAYSYVRNNPVVLVDPGGMSGTPWSVYLPKMVQAELQSHVEALTTKTSFYGIWGARFTPADTYIDIAETITGKDFATGEDLSISDRVVSGGFVFAPVLSAKFGRIVKEGAVDIVSDAFAEAADHVLEKGNRFLGKSREWIENMAKRTKQNADIKINIKNKDGSRMKTYYYTEKNNMLFINNPAQPTLFQPSDGKNYLYEAVKDDLILRGGVLK